MHLYIITNRIWRIMMASEESGIQCILIENMTQASVETWHQTSKQTNKKHNNNNKKHTKQTRPNNNKPLSFPLKREKKNLRKYPILKRDYTRWTEREVIYILIAPSVTLNLSHVFQTSVKIVLQQVCKKYAILKNTRGETVEFFNYF